MECRHDNPVAGFECAGVNKSHTHAHTKSTHQHVVPQQSTQNATNLWLQTCEKNQWTFLLILHFSACTNFANLCFFAKNSAPVFHFPFCGKSSQIGVILSCFLQIVFMIAFPTHSALIICCPKFYSRAVFCAINLSCYLMSELNKVFSFF